MIAEAAFIFLFLIKVFAFKIENALFLSGDNDGYTSQDGKDADGKLEGETLAEDADADDDCRYRLQRSHDGSRSTADEIDGNRHEEERQYRWQQRQLGCTEPMHRSLQHLNLLACDKRIDEHRDESKQQDVKGELDVRHSRILPLVHGDDVERIEQRRTHHQRKTSRAQLIVSIALIEQAHTRYSQEDSQGS